MILRWSLEGKIHFPTFPSLATTSSPELVGFLCFACCCFSRMDIYCQGGFKLSLQSQIHILPAKRWCPSPPRHSASLFSKKQTFLSAEYITQSLNISFNIPHYFLPNFLSAWPLSLSLIFFKSLSTRTKIVVLTVCNKQRDQWFVLDPPPDSTPGWY